MDRQRYNSIMHVPLWDSAARRRAAITAVTLGTVVSAFEGTVVTSAMPTIVRELGGLSAYGWVFSAFLVTSTLTMLVCGKLADAFGRRPVFVGGMALFLIGSVLCGTSTSFGALIAFRAIQGLGAGTLQPMSLTIGADLYKLEERARVQAYSSAAWGVANVIGPVIGGWIVERASWRWVFLVNVPVGVIAVVLLLASYRDPPRIARAPIGVRGALLAGAATALASFALAPDGLQAMLARLAVAGLAAGAIALLVRHQMRGATPLLPNAVLAEPAVQAGLLAGACLGGILYTCSAYVPLWVIAHGRGNAVTAGITLVPLLAGWALGSSFSVRLLVTHGMRAIAMGGFGVALAGAMALVGVVVTGSPTSWALASLLVLGLGLGPVASASIIVPQSVVAWRDRGAVTSAVFALRMLGGSIAVAALGAAGGGGHETARFVGVALLALAGLSASAILAPRIMRLRPGEAVVAPAE
jgi:MFS family permease